MRSLKFAITALITASVALGAASPAFADRGHHHGKHWKKHPPQRVVVIDRRDYRDHRNYNRHRGDYGRYYHAPPPKKVVVYRDRHHYDRYDHHHHYKKKDNTGDVLLGVGLGAAALAGVIAATR